jgi:hypothetical protein
VGDDDDDSDGEGSAVSTCEWNWRLVGLDGKKDRMTPPLGDGVVFVDVVVVVVPRSTPSNKANAS